MNDDPQPFAPRMFESQRLSSFAYVPSPTSVSYSDAITERPAPCDVVSQVSHGKPNPNGSVTACATAASSCRFRSVTRSARWTSRFVGSAAASNASASS
jgi:hypothetical protein